MVFVERRWCGRGGLGRACAPGAITHGWEQLRVTTESTEKKKHLRTSVLLRNVHLHLIGSELLHSLTAIFSRPNYFPLASVIYVRPTLMCTHSPGTRFAIVAVISWRFDIKWNARGISWNNTAGAFYVMNPFFLLCKRLWGRKRNKSRNEGLSVCALHPLWHASAGPRLKRVCVSVCVLKGGRQMKKKSVWPSTDACGGNMTGGGGAGGGVGLCAQQRGEEPR